MIKSKSKNKIVFKNARIIDPCTGFDDLGGLLTEDKVIKDFGKNLFKDHTPDDALIIDCQNHILCPGFIDLNANIGEPGEEFKENINTASDAALASGITSIVCMPNTNPVIDQIPIIQYIEKRARETNGVKIYPAASITKNLEGKQLTEMGLLLEAGAILFSEANKVISNTKVMKQALTYAKNFNATIMISPQDPDLSKNGVMNGGALANKLGLPGIPKEAEIIQIERDIRLLESTGSKLHFFNITTNEAIIAIENAKKKGLNLTCSTAPHYFTLDETAVDEWRTFAKVFPPLRNKKDTKAIYDALIEDKIDIISSHHSPQDQDSKRLPFEQAEFRIIGLQTFLPLSLKLHFEGKMKLIDVIDKITYQPSKILNLKSGILKKDSPADICIFDLNHKYKLDIDNMKSKSKNSLFEDYEVKGKVMATVIDGRIVYKSPKMKI